MTQQNIDCQNHTLDKVTNTSLLPHIEPKKATTRKAKILPLELPLENSVGYQLRHADRAVEATLQNRLAAHRVPIGMWCHLGVLLMKDGLTQKGTESIRRDRFASITTWVSGGQDFTRMPTL